MAPLTRLLGNIEAFVYRHTGDLHEMEDDGA
jgi:hypothetical protein